MNTPICDFVRSYAGGGTLRAHMPGHKGVPRLGPEPWDLTEIAGADDLSHPTGVIGESQENAARVFGTAGTFYSTEGSSLCVRAMVYLALLQAREEGREPLLLAGRNAHKSFLTAAALLDAEVEWLFPEGTTLLSCPVTAQALEKAFQGERKPTAVYLTSPDYLGHLADLRALAEVCRKNGALLLVDNAHGAYLHFLKDPAHPMDLGADLCCDSAHKTLPVLTGGAYLHVSRTAPVGLREHARAALSLFSSTSPSYLILQSLDLANPYLAGEFPARLDRFLEDLAAFRGSLERRGIPLAGEEPMKVTIAAKEMGYSGYDLAGILRAGGIEPEFADPDFLVLMLTPETGKEGLEKLERVLAQVVPGEPLREPPPSVPRPRRRMTPRQALLSPRERIPVEEGLGRVCADPAVSCPPAVPILICGEEMDEQAIACFRYYGITHCDVTK